MPPVRINFTKDALLSLPFAEKRKTATYHDHGRYSVPGLILLVSSGSKTFYLYRKVNGKPERIRLGKFPHITIEQARSKARVENGRIEQGENSNANKRQVKAEMTLADLFDRYMVLHAKPYKRTWKNDQNMYDGHLKQWADRRISEISKRDVQTLHAAIMEKHPHQANRVRSLLSTVYSKAIAWGFEGANPVSGVKKYQERSRDRFIRQEELKQFFEAITEEPNETLRDYWLLSLYTGARQGNMLEMAWSDIDFEQREWRIPRTKTGEAHTVPLVSYALEILRRRRNANLEGNPWVFPGTIPGNHLATPIRAWARLIKSANLSGLRPHDLRRTLGSWMSICGVPLHIIGAALGHKGYTVTHIYARLQSEPILQGMEMACRMMRTHAESRGEQIPEKM